MDKKGFLLAEETLKIILGVIAIGFLAYLLFSIYQNNRTSNELELARETLNHLFSEIERQSTQVEIYNPDGWWLIGSEQGLCLCEDDDLNSCNGAGVCREMSVPYSINLPIKIEDPPVIIEVNHESGTISKS